MLLDLARALSFFVTILSLLALFDGAFFVVATTWQQRLVVCMMRVLLATGAALASGLLFRHSTHSPVSLSKTLPMQVFLWTLFSLAVVFVLAWYLDVYYVSAQRGFTLYAR